MTPLPQKFYNRPTLKVAQELLGQLLVRDLPSGTRLMAKITEVEAYIGPKDKASHASRGLTPRTQVMFGPPGYWYVYLVYGMYHCLNVVTEKEGYPAAVLIRGVENIDGPGKLCRQLQIDKSFNEAAAFKPPLFIAKGHGLSKAKILRAPRIGVDYAGEYKNKLWRFTLNELS